LFIIWQGGYGGYGGYPGGYGGYGGNYNLVPNLKSYNNHKDLNLSWNPYEVASGDHEGGLWYGTLGNLIEKDQDFFQYFY
jgi:hypothetical protein